MAAGLAAGLAAGFGAGFAVGMLSRFARSAATRTSPSLKVCARSCPLHAEHSAARQSRQLPQPVTAAASNAAQRASRARFAEDNSGRDLRPLHAQHRGWSQLPLHGQCPRPIAAKPCTQTVKESEAKDRAENTQNSTAFVSGWRRLGVTGGMQRHTSWPRLRDKPGLTGACHCECVQAAPAPGQARPDRRVCVQAAPAPGQARPDRRVRC